MRWVWVAVAVAMAGCSVALEDWDRVSGQARCERALRCSGSQVAVDCTRPNTWPVTSPEKQAFDAQQVGYSPSAAAECVERIKNEPCNVNVDLTPACRAAFPGKRLEGESCGVPLLSTCSAGLRCAIDAHQLCGTCARVTARGEPTAFEHPCDWGLTRSPGDAGSICGPLPEAGEACTPGIGCVEWIPCLRSSAGLTGTCDPGRMVGDSRDPGVGEWCEEPTMDFRHFGSQNCATDLFCLDGACAPAHALDEACSKDTDCLSTNCLDTAVCGPRQSEAWFCP